jgi:dTDP-4-amino-4,6-dideoxygalactose transaminase
MPSIPQTDPAAFVREHRTEIDAAMARVIDGGRYILGAEVVAFEREFSEALGLGNGIGVGNGTDAVALALRALRVGTGHRVATVSHTAGATVAAIEMVGAAPVFVDIDLTSYTMDPVALTDALEGAAPIHAVVVVHLYGQPANLGAILPLAQRHNIPVVEDCAQAHGARSAGRYVGTSGNAAAFSFYPTKNLGALGDGGLVATGDPDVAARVRCLREYGWRQRFISESPGVNSRLDELQAAILRMKLRYLDAGNRRRAQIAAAYDRGLRGSGLNLPAVRAGDIHVYHQYVVRHRDRDGLKARLAEKGIGTSIHYPLPLHRQPAYRERCAVGPGGLASTEAAARDVLSLPIYPELSDQAVSQVIGAVRAAL